VEGLALPVRYHQAGRHSGRDLKTAAKAHKQKVLVQERIDKTEAPLPVQLCIEAKLRQVTAVYLASKIQTNDAMRKTVLEIKFKYTFVFQTVNIYCLYFKDKHQ